GNQWGMPLRMILDSGDVRPEDVALVGARNLDPPEEEFIAGSDLHTGDWAIERALGRTDAVYVAVDVDAIDAEEIASHMPEPGGLSLAETEAMLRRIRQLAEV